MVWMNKSRESTKTDAFCDEGTAPNFFAVGIGRYEWNMVQTN